MRHGSVFRLCSRCKKRVKARDRKCAACGHDRATWGYQVDLSLPGTPRKQQMRTGFARREEAVAAMAEIQSAKASGTYVEPSRLTVAQYLEDWVAAGCGGVRGSTFVGYRVCVRRHIIPRIGEVPLQSLTRLAIQAMYSQLAESGNTRDSGGLSAKSVHNVQICLHAALEEAVRNKLLRSNPADSAHRKPRTQPEMKTWTAVELHAFLRALTDDVDLPLWWLAAQTGMRRGEVLGLRWRDVDLRAGLVSVRQQWSRQRGVMQFGPPKTAKGLRTIDIDPDTLAVLQQHRQAQEFQRRSWGEAYRRDLDLVFPRADGTPQDSDRVGKRFDRVVRRLSRGGLPVRDIRFHDLRHTHATLLLEDGFDAKYVSERLGHDSVRTTLELYGHVTSKRRAHAAARIGALLHEAGPGDPVVIQPGAEEADEGQ